MPHVGDQSLDQYLEEQFRQISECLKARHLDNASARSDQSEDNAILEKLLLSSFNFGLTSPRQIRSFFEGMVLWASEPLLIFMAEIIELWERFRFKIDHYCSHRQFFHRLLFHLLHFFQLKIETI